MYIWSKVFGRWIRTSFRTVHNDESTGIDSTGMLQRAQAIDP
jgi:hypothetical protein